MGYAAVIEPFSVFWWRTSLNFLVIGVAIFIIMASAPKVVQRRFSKCLGVALLFDIAFSQFVYYYMGSWNIHWALPLQYCTVMEFCAAIVLITRGQKFYELVLFLGAVGPIQALITPAFPYAGDYFFYDFYFSHAAPIFVPIFLTITEGMRPRKNAWWKRVCGFALFIFAVFYFDYFTDSNYMFLMERPPLEHPLLGFGEWPEYIILWFAVILAWSALINLVFLISFRKQVFHR